MNFTIQNALIPVETGYETVDVHITEGRIGAIAPHLDPQGTLIDGTHKLLLPGFVNAHTHSSEMWQRGIIPSVPLELWIAELYEFAPLDPEHMYLSALGTAVETLLSGGTCVVDHVVPIPGKEIESVAAVAQAYREIGIRAFVGPLIQDQVAGAGMPAGSSPSDIGRCLRSTSETLEILEQIVQAFHQPDAGVSIMTAPTGIQLCSDRLFEGCVELSDRYQLCRHSHLLETKAQKLLAQEKYGCSAVQHLKEIGYLGPQTSLAHCVWLEDAEIDILAATQSTVVHNPLSNLRLGSGIAPLLTYRQRGVNVAFGCDGSASNDAQDLLEAIKIGSILHNITDFDYRQWITPRQAAEMASLGGAKGLAAGDRFGSLTVGKDADLVLYDLTSLSLLPRTDPIGLLILGRPTNAISHSWVRGRPVITDGQITTTDVAHLRQRLFELSSWIPQRQSKTVQAIEARYRSVMGLPD